VVLLFRGGSCSKRMCSTSCSLLLLFVAAADPALELSKMGRAEDCCGGGWFWGAVWVASGRQEDDGRLCNNSYVIQGRQERSSIAQQYGGWFQGPKHPTAKPWQMENARLIIHWQCKEASLSLLSRRRSLQIRSSSSQKSNGRDCMHFH
jgi:hypothetical protein